MAHSTAQREETMPNTLCGYHDDRGDDYCGRSSMWMVLHEGYEVDWEEGRKLTINDTRHRWRLDFGSMAIAMRQTKAH